MSSARSRDPPVAAGSMDLSQPGQGVAVLGIERERALVLGVGLRQITEREVGDAKLNPGPGQVF